MATCPCIPIILFVGIGNFLRGIDRACINLIGFFPELLANGINQVGNEERKFFTLCFR